MNLFNPYRLAGWVKIGGHPRSHQPLNPGEDVVQMDTTHPATDYVIGHKLLALEVILDALTTIAKERWFAQRGHEALKTFEAYRPRASNTRAALQMTADDLGLTAKDITQCLNIERYGLSSAYEFLLCNTPIHTLAGVEPEEMPSIVEAFCERLLECGWRPGESIEPKHKNHWRERQKAKEANHDS